MPKKKEPAQTKNGNGNEYGLRDFSHLPRLKDLLKAKKLTPQQKEPAKSQDGNGLRDYSHLPRLKDLPKPKKLTPLQKELQKAGHEALKALEEEVKKYGTTFT